MTWADFYLVCFVVGFAFSFLSYVLGGVHWHLPFGHHAGHLPAGPQAHAGTGAPGAGGAAKLRAAGRGGSISPFNIFSLAAFLTWFGGSGYLLTRYSGVAFAGALTVATAVGALGAAIVFLFLSRVLMSKEENLDPADFDMVGVLGRLSLPIREGGTGEIIYSQAGTRRTCGARSEDGGTVERGVEVVVTRYEKGIAYVRKWEEISSQ
jgi:hypothetical protein